ncbi:MAG: universal stress protein [Pseudomonadota bacterium]
MYHKIMLATDLSDMAKQAARKAWELANQFDAKLYVVHVIEPIPAYGYPGVTEIESPYIDSAKQALNQLLEPYLVPQEHIHVVIGSVKQEVVNKTKELEIDLLILGSHGRHGITRWLGSTANAILHAVESDVVIVRAK